MELPPISYLRECLQYDPAIGELRWKTRPEYHFFSERQWRRWNTRYAGAIAGSLKADGNRRVSIDDRLYPADRIASALMTVGDPHTKQV